MHALPVLCGSCWVSESVSPRIDISVKEGDFFFWFFFGGFFFLHCFQLK